MGNTVPPSPFQKACREGDVVCVEELLTRESAGAESGVTETHQGLYIACSTGRVEVARLLLGLQGPHAIDMRRHGCEALATACLAGHPEVVRLLLAQQGEGAIDVHFGEDAAGAGAELGPILMELQRILAGRRGATREWPLLLACCGCGPGCAEVVSLLLSLTGGRAVDVHAGGDLGLQWACGCAHRADATLRLFTCPLATRQQMSLAQELQGQGMVQPIFHMMRRLEDGNPGDTDVACQLLRMRRFPAHLVATLTAELPPQQRAAAVCAYGEGCWSTRRAACMARAAGRRAARQGAKGAPVPRS